MTNINPSNSFISSEICNNEDENLRELNTHYIFIVDETTEAYVPSENKIADNDTYETLLINPAIESTILETVKLRLKELCNDRNIIIYLLLADYVSNSKPDYAVKTSDTFVEKFSKMLSKDVPNKYHNNVIILNFFDSSKISKTTTFLQNSDIYKQICLSNFYNYADNSKKYFRVLNVCCDNSFNGKEFEIENKFNQNLKDTYRIISTSSLYDFNQIKDLIIERRCSSGKLIQFTGTCWMNSVLNSLFLPKSSRKYFIKQCKKYLEEKSVKNKTALQNIYDLRGTLSYENMLNSIIYNIFIKKERPSDKSKNVTNDFMLTLADKMKRIWVANYPTSIPILYKKTEFEKIQKSIKNKNFDDLYGDGASMECTISSLKIILEYFMKDFTDYYCVFVTKNPKKLNRTEIDKMEKPEIQQKIESNGKKYVLSSCILSQLGNHLVCGFTCNGKEYIYNSNFNIAVECNWSKYSYQPYVDYRNRYFGDSVNNDVFIYLHAVIYTLETEEEIEDTEIENNEIIEEANDIVVPDIPCNLTNNVEPPPVKNSTNKTQKKKECSPDQEFVNGKCYKKCKENQTRNAMSGRCRKTSCNPTQEFVNRKCYKKCNENQIRNPATNRCIRKTAKKR